MSLPFWLFKRATRSMSGLGYSHLSTSLQGLSQLVRNPYTGGVLGVWGLPTDLPLLPPQQWCKGCVERTDVKWPSQVALIYLRLRVCAHSLARPSVLLFAWVIVNFPFQLARDHLQLAVRHIVWLPNVRMREARSGPVFGDVLW